MSNKKKKQFLLKTDKDVFEDFKLLCENSHITITKGLTQLMEYSIKFPEILNPFYSYKNIITKDNKQIEPKNNDSVLEPLLTRLIKDINMIKKVLIRDPLETGTFELKIRRLILNTEKFTIKQLENLLLRNLPEEEENITVLKLYQSVLLDLEKENLITYDIKKNLYIRSDKVK